MDPHQTWNPKLLSSPNKILVQIIMLTDTLRKYNNVLYHSVIKYDIISWVRVHNNNLYLLQNLQKIVNKDQFNINNPSLNLQQLLTHEFFMFHYENQGNLNQQA